MDILKLKKIIKSYYLYIIIFIIFFVIGLFVPTGGDDWEISGWYSEYGLFNLFCKSIYTWNTFNVNHEQCNKVFPAGIPKV